MGGVCHVGTFYGWGFEVFFEDVSYCTACLMPSNSPVCFLSFRCIL